MLQYTATPTPLVWGGIMCIVQLTLQFTSCCEKIINAFKGFSNMLRLIVEFSETLYHDSEPVQDALASVFAVLLKFCRVFTSAFINEEGQIKSSLQIFDQTWKPYESEYKGIILEMEKLAQIVAKEMQHVDNRVVHTGTRIRAVSYERATSRLQRIKSIVTTDGKELRQKKRRTILTWISTLNFETEHERAYGSRHGTTGSWLLADERFKKWIVSANSTLLWCCGKPGSGKTVMASIVLECVRNLFPNNHEAILYVYCDSQQENHSKAYNLIASLLQQICAKEEDIPTPVEEAYDKSQEGKNDLTWYELKELFLKIMSLPREKIVIFDGLDECEDCELICHVLKQLAVISASVIKVFVTSRSRNRTISTALSKYPTIELDEYSTSIDIRSFTCAEIESLSQAGKLHTKSSTLKQEIVDVLVEKSEGMFLWVRFQMETLCAQTTDEEIHTALHSLPSGLEKVYQRCFELIGRQSPSQKDLARKVLMWTLYTKASLHLFQLLDALAVIPGTFGTDENNRINDASMIVSVCAGLITVDKYMTVRFTHSSVRDFLISPEVQQSQVLGDMVIPKLPAGFQIGQVCLSYLCKEDVRTCRISTMEDANLFLLSHPFTLYATQFWSEHVRGQLEEDLESSLLEFLHCKGVADFCSVWRHMARNDFEDFESFSENPSPLTIVIQERLEHVLKVLPELESYLEQKNHQGYTPLIIAIQNNYEETAKHLIARGANVNERGIDGDPGKTPLFLAVEKGLPDIVAVLLQHGAGLDLEISQGIFPTPLFAASAYGHTKVVELLISAGANIEARDHEQVTPLLISIVIGNVDIVRYLLKVGADISARSMGEKTALHIAMQGGTKGPIKDADIVKILLENHIEIDARDAKGATALHDASGRGRDDLAILLLDAGADVNARDANGETCLHQAADQGHLGVAEILLSRGTDPNIRSDNSRTALHLAAAQGSEPLVSLLLRYKADYLLRISTGETPLHYAAVYGKEDAVKALLLAGATCDDNTNTGVTPLQYAVCNGHVKAAQCLIEHGADWRLPKMGGWTALHEAAQGGHLEVVRLLLQTGAGINAQDERGRSSLQIAIVSGFPLVVQCLIEQGADWSLQDKDGSTALHEAAQGGHLEVVQLLLKVGADVNAQDEKGRSSLQIAIVSGFPLAAQCLIEHGADWSLPDKDGSTALHEAAQEGHLEVVQLLLKAGADVNAQDENGCSLLLIAIVGGYPLIVQCLVEHGAELSIPNIGSWTALHLAAQGGYLETVRILLKAGVDVNAQDEKGHSSLQRAIVNGYPLVAHELLDAGADASLLDRYGRSCVDYATASGIDLGCKLNDKTALEKHVRLNGTIASLVDKLSNANLTNIEEAVDFDYLGRALLFSQEVHDHTYAAICFEQGANRTTNGEVEHQVVCNNCMNDVRILGDRFVCRSCEESDLCNSCHDLYKEGNIKLPACKDHSFLKIPRDEWADLAPGTVLSDGTKLMPWLENLKLGIQQRRLQSLCI
jgi:ankyrin repeat protein